MTRPGASPRRAGFTIIEILVALVFLTVVAIALASAIEQATRTVRHSRVELDAGLFLETEAERLRAMPYDSLTAGSRSLGLGTANWTVSDSAGSRRIVLVTRYGDAGSRQVWDTVSMVRLR